MRRYDRLFFLLAAGFAAACASSSLSSAGRGVRITASPAASCRQLGFVTGRGGGAVFGRYVANDKLVQSATADALNQAAEMKGTHLQLGAPMFGTTRGTTTTTTATVFGIVFACPDPALAPTGAEALPSP